MYSYVDKTKMWKIYLTKLGKDILIKQKMEKISDKQLKDILIKLWKNISTKLNVEEIFDKTVECVQKISAYINPARSGQLH